MFSTEKSALGPCYPHKTSPNDTVRARRLHPWQVTIRQAKEIQLRLRRRLSFRTPAGFQRIEIVAGADVAFERSGRETRAYAAIVSLRLPELSQVEIARAVVPVKFPYVPGYLSFREIPALVRAWRRLRARPDALVLDAHGYAHPRRMGLACHAGLIFDVPTIGCAKSLLVGTHGRLGVKRGSRALLTDDGEVVGCALRTRSGVKPVYVSVGHRVDLDTASDIVLRLTPGGRFRSPEPTRLAHQVAGRLRREGGAGGRGGTGGSRGSVSPQRMSES